MPLIKQLLSYGRAQLPPLEARLLLEHAWGWGTPISLPMMMWQWEGGHDRLPHLGQPSGPRGTNPLSHWPRAILRPQFCRFPRRAHPPPRD